MFSQSQTLKMNFTVEYKNIQAHEISKTCECFELGAASTCQKFGEIKNFKAHF